MTIPRSVLEQAFPGQPRMQAVFETLVSDADDAIGRLNIAIAAIGDLSGGAADIVVQLAQKQPKNDTLSAIAAIPAEAGVLEQIDAGTIAIRPIDAADTRSLLTREVADSRYLGAEHPASGALIASNNLSDLASKVTARANLATSLGNYADDAAAAGGGVGIGEWYRNGSALMFRVA